MKYLVTYWFSNTTTELSESNDNDAILRARQSAHGLIIKRIEQLLKNKTRLVYGIKESMSK